MAAALTAALTITGCKDDREPGTEPSDVQGLFINEICSGGTDWIELYNAGETEMNLTGFHVQDNKGTDEEYTFPDGSTIPAKVSSSEYQVTEMPSQCSTRLMRR